MPYELEINNVGPILYIKKRWMVKEWEEKERGRKHGRIKGKGTEGI